MNWPERIVIDPEILAGKPVIKGTRLSVDFIIDLLAQGWSQEEILYNYPGLTRKDILACLGSVLQQPNPSFRRKPEPRE